MARTHTFVVDEADVQAQRADGDTASVRVTFDVASGSDRLEQRIIRFAPGRSHARMLDGKQEVLYVASGRGQLVLDGDRHGLAPDTAAFVAVGESYEIENPGPEELVLVSVLAPSSSPNPAGPRKVTVRFDDQPELSASAERTFRYLVDVDAGCTDLTQFMGIVQPSKAPMHSHSYDEVGYVVEGEGVAHIRGRSMPIAAGSCFHLPPNEVHCIENSGTGVMRILGVFHPAGSPASRAYEDNK